jgi:hypothetical protein
MVLNIALGAGITLWLFVNGARVYAYSRNLDVEDDIVRTYEGAGYDYESMNGYSEQQEIIQGDSERLVGRMELSRYDAYESDNYEYQRLKDAYGLDTTEVMIGTLMCGAVAVAYLWQLWQMTWNWKLFLQKSIDAASHTGSTTSLASNQYASSLALPKVGAPESAPALTDEEKAKASKLIKALGGGPGGRLKGKLKLAMEIAREQKEAERTPPPQLQRSQHGSARNLLRSYADLNKEMIDKFVQSHAKIGTQDASEVSLMLLTIAIGFSGFYAEPLLLAAGVFLMAAIYVVFVLTRDSTVGQVIMYETLEVTTQIYQLLVWSGVDVLQWLTLSEAEYQDKQASFAISGDGGAAVVGLAWLLCINLVCSPLLFITTRAYTINHTLLDMGLETAYGAWAMIVAVRRAAFLGLPLAVHVPGDLPGFVLKLYPWIIILFHMPEQIRDSLVALLILDKLEDGGAKVAPEVGADGGASGRDLGRRRMNKDEHRHIVVRLMRQRMLENRYTSRTAACFVATLAASAVAATAWITAVVIDPTIVSDTCDDAGFSRQSHGEFGTEYWMCQLQDYGWSFDGSGSVTVPESTIFDSWMQRLGYLDSTCPPGTTGTLCAIYYQMAKRQALVGAEDVRSARALSLTRGCLCFEPVAYTYDFARQIEFPDSFLTRYAGVRELVWSARGLDALPSGVSNLATLEFLQVSGNSFVTLPDSLTSLERLWFLSLSVNALTTLPEDLGDLGELKYLWLDSNALTAVPESVTQLTKLYWLRLDNNQITLLPERIGDLKNLETLQLAHNALTRLPDSLAELSNLRDLSFKINALTATPSLEQMTLLRRLDLFSNDFSEVPEGIHLCESLEVVRLENNNRLVSLPPALAVLPNLNYVGLFGTPFCDGFVVKNGTLDPAFDELVAEKVVTCCLPEFQWPCPH